MKRPCWSAGAVLLLLVGSISLMVPRVGAIVLKHAAPVEVDLRQPEPILSSNARPPCANPKGVGAVANSGENTVSFLNLELNQECARLDVPSGAIGASVTPDGMTALVSSFGAQRVSLFDLTVDPPLLAGTIATTTLTESVCITPDSRFAVTVDGSAGIVDVRSIDIANRTTVNSVSIAGATGCVISDQSVPLGFFTVVIADFNNNLFRVLRLDVTTGTISNPGVSVGNPGSGLDVIAISARGRSLAIATNFFSNNVTILHIDSMGNVTAEGTLATGSAPGSLAIAPNGEMAWVVNHNTGNLAKLAISPSDVVTDTGIRLTIPGGPPDAFFGAPGIAINAESAAGLVSNVNSNTLQQLDLIDNRFTGMTITVGQRPAQIGLPGGGIPSAADLDLAKTDSPDPAEVGNKLTYTLAVTNQGPAAATGVILTDTLPTEVTFVSATPSQGSCSGTNTITCNLGTINNGASATVAIAVTAPAPVVITNTASVTSDITDPDPINNTATASTTVWSLLLSDGTNLLGVNTATGEFTLTYMVDGVVQSCSGTHARVDDGFLTIADRCSEDSRDTIRGAGPTNGSLTVELIDQTGPTPSDRTIRHFTLVRAATGSTCVQPPEGLVSWWPGDGDAKDLIGGNDGTLQNGATFGPGMVGQAFSFDGVNAFVDAPDSASLNPISSFTIEGWFFIDPNAPGNAGELSTLTAKSDGSSTGGGWWLLFDDGQLGCSSFSKSLRFNVFGGPAIIAEARADNILTTANWYHIAGVFDLAGTPQAKLYLNGNLVASSTATISSILANSLSLRIGAMHFNETFGLGCGNDRLNGLADEVAFYNVALTQTQIQAIFNAGSAGKCQTMRVLGIETTSSWAYTLVPSLSRVTFTTVSAADFATVNLNNFDVLLVSETFLDGSVTIPAQATLDALQARAPELATWISAGHGVVALAEPIGTGRFAWLPEAVRPTVGSQIHVDTVHIVNPTHPVMAGLTDDGLSGWGTASHGNFTSAGGLDVLVNDGGARPITLAGTFGQGKIVITDQDPDFHHHFGTVKPDQVTLVQNAITWAATPAVTSVASLAELALTGCTSCHPGEQLVLEATITPGPMPVAADVYIAIQLPDQSLFFMQADGSFTREAWPIVAGWHMLPFRGKIFHFTFGGGEPAGHYTWLMAFAEPGTPRIIGGIARAAFTFSP